MDVVYLCVCVWCVLVHGCGCGCAEYVCVLGVQWCPSTRLHKCMYTCLSCGCVHGCVHATGTIVEKLFKLLHLILLPPADYSYSMSAQVRGLRSWGGMVADSKNDRQAQRAQNRSVLFHSWRALDKWTEACKQASLTCDKRCCGVVSVHARGSVSLRVRERDRGRDGGKKGVGMDGWMDGWMGGWMEGWMNAMFACTSEWLDIRHD